MPRTSYPAPSRTETPAGLRDMAVRARRLAWGMPDALTVARLNAFAAELEARAAALEPAAQIFLTPPSRPCGKQRMTSARANTQRERRSAARSVSTNCYAAAVWTVIAASRMAA